MLLINMLEKVQRISQKEGVGIVEMFEEIHQEKLYGKAVSEGSVNDWSINQVKRPYRNRYHRHETSYET